MPYMHHRYYRTPFHARCAMRQRMAEARAAGVKVGHTIRQNLNLGWYLVEYQA